jgi:diaminopimelate epimerase
MKSLKFVKMQGSGNDFVVVEKVFLGALSGSSLAKKMCDRRFGAGADGLLLLDCSHPSDVSMRIFNPDGSEVPMCGNGARCCALYAAQKRKKKNLEIMTKAGLLRAEVDQESVKLKMTDPEKFQLGINLKVGGKRYELDYLDTGVPHAVMEVENVEEAPVGGLGRLIRCHKVFLPQGANVNFFQRRARGEILIRTYERGVEDETLACGTGSVASAIISVLKQGASGLDQQVGVLTQSGERLKVYFKVSHNKVSDVWLEGKASVVYTGEYYV